MTEKNNAVFSAILEPFRNDSQKFARHWKGTPAPAFNGETVERVGVFPPPPSPELREIILIFNSQDVAGR